MLFEYLIPVYGETPYLDNTLKSIYKNPDDKSAVLMVLDRPTEKQHKQVMKYVNSYQNFRVIMSQGEGIAFALNTGINYSTAKYIRRIDSDDELLPGSLEKQILFLESNYDFACVGGQMNFIDENGEIIGETHYPTMNCEIISRFEYQNCIAHPATLFNRLYIQNSGGYRSAMSGAEDYDLWLRVSNQYKIANLDIKVTNYRISEKQYSKSLGSRQLLIENLARADWVHSKLNLGVNDLPKGFKNEDEIKCITREIEKSIKKTSKNRFFKLQSAKKINQAMKISQKDLGVLTKRLKQAILLIQAGILSPTTSKHFASGLRKFRNVRY